jgi:hypothetical protein
MRATTTTTTVKTTMTMTRRRRPRATSTRLAAWTRKDDDEIWDEDERRRIEENKRWRRTDPPENAWDIDKERDALMYKRESLESLLRLEYTPEEGKDGDAEETKTTRDAEDDDA